MDCPNCSRPMSATPGWCDGCRRAVRVGARTLAAWLLDDGVDLSPPTTDPDPLDWPGYDDQRSAARAAAEADESVVVMRGRVRDSDVEAVAIVWDFGFMGGSMGTEAGARIVAGYDAAREAGLPVVLLPSTGGARMQEGMTSLVQMAATTAAAIQHREAGLLQVTVLRDPTTGGVFVSHANQAHVLLAEPGATIGFAGPRVAEAMTGGPLPEGSHTARGAKAAGLVDAVVERPDLPAVLAPLLAWPGATTGGDGAPGVAAGVAAADAADVGAGLDPWSEVEASRAPDRDRAPAFLAAVDVAFELHGDRAGGDDPSIRVALARWRGRPVVVVAMDRTRDEAITPGGFRKAWRGITVAQSLDVPLVTLIDTPGADASASSEAGGIGAHIAETFRRLMSVPVPVVALVTGEGGSGGALALAVGDRLLIQEHATFSVIAPEGAAAILHRDRDRAPEVAALLDPTARRLQALGIADEVVPERPGSAVADAVDAVARHLADLGTTGAPAARLARWRTTP